MLRETGGSASRLQLTKWAFLLASETSSQGGNACDQFLPYRFGPYSFSLYQEMDSLARDGLVEVDNQAWALTSVGHNINLDLSPSVTQDVLSIIKRYGKFGSNKLTESIYNRYPWFTVNSERQEKRAQIRPTAPPAVYTMGYEGLMVDGFLNILMQQGIRRLVDVRHNPISRRYGFHKSTLARLCGHLQLEYIHMPELGIPSENRQELRAPDDYQNLFDYYENIVLAYQTNSVNKLVKLLREKPSALVCMEADPMLCHRSHLADRIALLCNLHVLHLGWPR